MKIIITIFHAIFGDRVAERAGKAFLEYFGGTECPPEVCRDIELGLIYYGAMRDRADTIGDILATNRALADLLDKKREARQK